MIKIVSQSDSLCNPGIYKITCLANEKVYVGSAVNLDRRYKEHFKSLEKGKHPNQYLQKTFNKYGSESFTFEVIEFIDDVRYLIRAEQVWLDYYKASDRLYGFNICPKAYSCLGVKRSEETRAKIRGNQYGKGYKPSVEKRAKQSAFMREFMKGRTHSKGYKHTTEALAKMREASKGRIVSENTRLKLAAVIVNKNSFYWVITSPDGTIYDPVFNLKKFCREHNLHHGNMGYVASGKYKQCKGWLCQKVEK